MNNRLKDLKGKKETLLTRMKAINALVDKRDNNTFTDEENKEFDGLEAEMKVINRAIKREEMIMEEMRSMAATAKPVGEQPGEANNRRAAKPSKTPEEKVAEKYSITRHIRLHMNGEKLNGLEAEMEQEAIKEQRDAGVSGSPGALKIPSILVGADKRDMVAGTDNVGGYAIETELREMIPYLYPKLKTQDLGARVLTGLVGDVTFPTMATASVASWAAENASAAETNPTLGLKTLTPKRLTAKSHVSGQLLHQTNPSIDAMLAGDLRQAIGTAVDAAVIAGSGTSNQPTGIMNLAGVTTVALGANGLAPTRAAALAMIGGVEDNNADVGKLGWLTTPGVRRTYQDIKTDTGSGIFVWNQDTPNQFMGYRAEVSTQVPSNLTKGSGTDLHGMVFGNWDDFVIGNWAGIELIIDQYSLAGDNLVRLIIHAWYDMFARHDKSFSVMKDIIV